MMIAAAVSTVISIAASTMASATASIRRRVRKVSGRKMAKTSAFHTQAHFSAPASGKSAHCRVMKHHTRSAASRPCRIDRRKPSFFSATAQPPKASRKAISETGSNCASDQPIFCGARMSM